MSEGQRSGSTNQVLRGPALDRFLLGKTGRCWDGMPDPRVSLEDLDTAAIAGFRKRVGTAKRLAGNALDENDARLIDRLRLTDGDYLTKAAILLFCRDPERFVPGAHVKVGYFRNESDVLFHDVISGGLFTQVDRTIEVLLFKYLKAGISYEGIQRVESYPMPEPALREVLLNAVVHRDYAVPTPIQIRVHDDRLRIFNPGSLPEGWTLDKLLGPHPSRPYNPDIANAFFWAGEIETWGRGIDRVLRACRRAGAPEPTIQLEPGGLWFEFGFSDDYLESVGLKRKPTGGQTDLDEQGRLEVRERHRSGVVDTLPAKAERILALLRDDPTLTHAALAAAMGISTYSVRHHLDRLRDSGAVRRVGSRKTGYWEIM